MFWSLPEVLSGENPEVVPCSREFRDLPVQPPQAHRHFSHAHPLIALAAFAGGRHSVVIDGWSCTSPFMSEPRSCSPCSLALPASSLCPLCCLPAPSPSAAVSHLSPASASSTAKLIWLRSSEIPARDRDASQFDFCC